MTFAVERRRNRQVNRRRSRQLKKLPELSNTLNQEEKDSLTQLYLGYNGIFVLTGDKLPFKNVKTFWIPLLWGGAKWMDFKILFYTRLSARKSPRSGG